MFDADNVAGLRPAMVSRRHALKVAAATGVLAGLAEPAEAASADAPADMPHALAVRNGTRNASVGVGDLRPFRVHVPAPVLRGIRRRLERTDFPEAPFATDFTYGPPPSYMRALVRYWLRDFNWRHQEQRLNRWPQFQVPIDGERMHFARVPGSGRATPLLMLHGWPYSFGSLLDVAERLAQPERFGGRAQDGRDVILPSLPGYGFSDRPAAPIDSRTMAGRFYLLMTTVLRYQHFVVQGGDLGAVAMTWMALDHPEALLGIHYNTALIASDSGLPLGVIDPGTGPLTEAGRQAVLGAQVGVQAAFGYLFQQASRPLTIAYWTDSPAGAAAWFVDKYFLWTDQRNRSFSAALTRDQMLTEIMIYLTSGTFDSSLWVYHANNANNTFVPPAGFRVRVPTGIAAFPDPLLPPPSRAEASHTYNVVHYEEPPAGGHFPMLETPGLLERDVARFLRELDR